MKANNGSEKCVYSRQDLEKELDAIFCWINGGNYLLLFSLAKRSEAKQLETACPTLSNSNKIAILKLINAHAVYLYILAVVSFCTIIEL